MMDLQGQFLIATLELDNDDYFARSVIYMCEHSEHGSMGLVITAPTDLSIVELLAKMDFLMANDEREYKKDQMVLSGGPIAQERGFILHTTTYEIYQHSYVVSDNISLTTSGDILDTLGTEIEPEKFLVCLGCATWAPNQLEKEIAENAWIVSPANEKTLFETGYLDRWDEANEMLGIIGVLGKAGNA